MQMPKPHIVSKNIVQPQFMRKKLLLVIHVLSEKWLMASFMGPLVRNVVYILRIITEEVEMARVKKNITPCVQRNLRLVKPHGHAQKKKA